MKSINQIFLISLFVIAHISFSESKKIALNSKMNLGSKNQMSLLTKPLCIEPSFAQDAKVESIISKLNELKTPEEKIQKLPEYFKILEGKIVSPQMTARLFTSVYFADKLDSAIEISKDSIWLDSKSLANVINKVRSHPRRTKIVQSLFPILIDHDAVNLELISDYLECDQKKLVDTLKLKFKPRNCFISELKGNIVFVLDLSASMVQRFTINGVLNSRIGFLKKLIRDAVNDLKENQEFQIVTFNSKAQYIDGKNKLYPATEEMKKKTIEAINNLHLGQGEMALTNFEEALKFTYDLDFNINKVVFFTDGSPTVGKRTLPEIENIIKESVEKRNAKKLVSPKIDINLLMLEGKEPQDERDFASKATELIAKITSGTVKNFVTKK